MKPLWSTEHDGLAEVAIRSSDKDDPDADIGIPASEYVGISIVALLAIGEALIKILDESDLKDQVRQILDKQADVWYYG